MPGRVVAGAVEVGAVGKDLGREALAAESLRDFWARELAQRLALVTPADTARGMFFRATLEAIRALGDEALVRRCLKDSEYENFVEFFHYPIRLQLQMISIALEPLAARHGCQARGLRLLGRQGASGFLRSRAGGMLLMMARGEKKRLLEVAPIGFRMALSYSQHTLRWRGPTQVHWMMQRSFMPYPFLEGVFLTLLEGAGARDVRVVGRQTGTLDSEYDISWA